MRERLEFRVPVDQGAYYLGTIGIVALAAVAAGIVAMFAAIFSSTVRQIPADVMMGLVAFVALWAGAAWIWRRVRIHRERKLVIDDDGITYYKLADRPRVMGWSEIASVIETEALGEEGDYRRLDIKMSGWGKFRIVEGDFIGYPDIRGAIIARLPDKTQLVKPQS